jgi:Protein phosphatase 2C
LNLAVKVRWAPKDGCAPREYEDAIAWSRRRRRFAVADGASASAFARCWARLLVQAYVAGRLTAERLEDDLHPLQTRWSAFVDRPELPWYAVEQARRGAFAALVGLTLRPNARWSALAVGDSCLFQVRDGQLLNALPISDPQEFGNNPLLIGSRPLANAALRANGAIVQAAGEWAPGDTFLLMSDALAAAFLKDNHLGFKHTTRGFRRWIRDLRAERLLRNDDVSLVWLAVPTDAAA